MKKGITAKELAEKLNLSETAVSMALNHKPGVSTETRALVISEAERMGYDFSRLAQKNQKNGDIYCVSYRTHNAILNYSPIFSELLDGIQKECRQSGYRLKTLQIFEKNDDVQKCIEDLRVNGCIGVVLLGTEISAAVCQQFLKLSVPVVLLDTYFDSLECSSVLINNTQGAYHAANYLIDRTGHQPGHLASSYRIHNFSARKKGFERAIREHGLSVSKTIVHELAPSIEGAFSDMLEVIDRGDELAKCYFADNDLIAIGVIKALRTRGYRIPEDISVVGFDNISESRVIDPALTTVDIPRMYMGHMAAKQLIQQMQDPVPHTVKIEISTRLVKRFSV